jgi:hypothetical protein
MFDFPMEYFPQGTRIILYGCGNIGKIYANQLLASSRCELVCVLDRNYENISLSGTDVCPPSDISGRTDYDFVIVALVSDRLSREVYFDLLKLGVPEPKILLANEMTLKDRVLKLELLLSNLGIDQITRRIDMCLIRLEILQYYAIPENYAMLDDEMRAALNKVQNWNKIEKAYFQEDRYYSDAGDSEKMHCQADADGNAYFLVNGKKVYLNRDLEGSNIHYKAAILHALEDPESPHIYLEPEKDGIDVPEGAVLLDIGAAEGYFGMKYLERCSKVYFFECDTTWLYYLGKTVEPYAGKAVIVSSMVGDGPDCVRLDDYFADISPKPDFVKIDVEGMEGAVLRSMQGMLDSDDPLTLLICTYHRQEDRERYERFLNPDTANPRFSITSSSNYYWHMPDPKPPYFRRGIMRAVKCTRYKSEVHNA